MEVRVDANVTLHPLNQGFANDLFTLTNSNRNFLREWLPWLDQVLTVDDTRHFIETTEKMAATGDAHSFAIVHLGTVCGVTGFNNINQPHHTGSIGYWLAQTHTGQGIATSAVRQLLNIGFTEYTLNRIEIRCALNNRRSRALPERLGFVYEGTLRQAEWLYDRFVDQALYALLKSDYRP
jgi:ribosomal-protein-serine acetyltransferase